MAWDTSRLSETSVSVEAAAGQRGDYARPTARQARDQTVAALLGRAGTRLCMLGPAFAVHAGQLTALRQRLEEGRFHLAVLGQFKRGKSTLLNALLGEAVLPTAVVPLTAVPTFIVAGTSRRVRVHFQAGRGPEEFHAPSAADATEIIFRFVAEAANPRNRLGVSHVEVFHPAPILTNGVVLIDTPGIGSTFQHNTEAALNFLPQCDAAVFLVSADPPITQAEVEFLRAARAKAPRLFFVLNKVDYLSEAERREALDFLKDVLREHAGLSGEAPVFCVSARMGLEARQRGDSVLWARSGIAAVEAHLVDFLATEKAATLSEAVVRKARNIVAEVVLRLRLTVRSMRMPLQDLQERLQVFEERLAEAGRERSAAQDLLTGDRKRLHELLERHADALRHEARGHFAGVVRHAVAEVASQTHAENAARGVLVETVPAFFERRLGETNALFRSRMADLLRAHDGRVTALVETVQRTAADLFEVPHVAAAGSDPIEPSETPYWVTHAWDLAIQPVSQGVIDRLVPAGVRQRRVMIRLLALVDALVIRNVENLRWSIFQTVEETFRRAAQRLDERWEEAMLATRGALAAVSARRTERATTVSAEARRLEAEIEELAEIADQLGRE
jgi:GTP-binding protein EngB required for normal cell division